MNVVELLESKQIPYQISGSDFVVRCLNPDHADKHPSMRIDQVLGIFQCMSCGFKGNLFHFYDEQISQLAVKREKLRRKIQETRAMQIGLEMPEGALPYVGGWRDIRPETYKKFGAFKSHQTEFLGRIVFPIRDITGKIVVFQGRDDTGTLKAKYYNYPRGVPLPMFPSVEPKKGSVILVEGLFDMLNLHDKGLDNAMCIFGVNQFNRDKLNMLKMRGVTGIDILMDADEAGDKAADEIKELVNKDGLQARRIRLDDGVDPGSLSIAQVHKLRRQLYGE